MTFFEFKIASFGLSVCLLFVSVHAGPAQTFDEKFEHWPVDLKINGTVIVSRSTDDSKAISVFKELLDRNTDRENLTAPLILWMQGQKPDKEAWTKALGEDFQSLTFKGDETVQSGPAFLEIKADKLYKVKSSIHVTDHVVLISKNGNASDLVLKLKDSLQDLINRKGVLMVQGRASNLIGSSGLDLVPDAVVDTRFDKAFSEAFRASFAGQSGEKKVALGISQDAVFLFRGRKLMVTQGKVSLGLNPSEKYPFASKTLIPREGRRQDPNDYLADWTQWRRRAIDRSIAPFPPEKPPVPHVENGTLFIVGGGGMPRNLMNDFVKAAGGKEAKLVYVPCSERDSVGTRHGIVSAWARMGVASATFIHTKDRNQSNSDDAFLEPLKDATGIWFGGGRQWNFADSYYGTKAHRLMKEVLKRGGAIGGSSAGASIQARYLARATPIGNFDVMAPGYERGGLGFIGGVAIDQHFSQRRRQKDMTQLVDKYPQMLGIGIDEATAIVVTKSNAKVVGRGRVHFYDRNLPVVKGQPDYIALPAGSEYELAQRKVIVDTTKSKKNEKGESEAGENEAGDKKDGALVR